ncbi:MAG: type I-G CRISPR-associated helicase/endonuclease Cas3g [Phycisphaerae bacterium]
MFEKVTGNKPLGWQRRLYKKMAAGDIPLVCSLPTGLGKTSVIAIWLIALASGEARLPRRLAYVVNRRTIVDQATREAEKLRENLKDTPNLLAQLRKLIAIYSDIPLAISTLRGQFADNGEWSMDPARPAIIVGTVDMIGSRLLFSGYGRGFKHRPLYAGFLGQDTLLVHDEAHLEPAFQILIDSIQAEQQRCRDFRPLRVMALTATPRQAEAPFALVDEDYADPIVSQRIDAKKTITLHAVDPKRGATAAKVVELAMSHEDTGSAILIFVRTIDDVRMVCTKLPKGRCQALIGTLRGLERDRLAREDTIFARFLPKPKPEENLPAEPLAGTVYLVCTSAGEVGVDMSADHLVCDLTPFDSMAQRFGRVNRYGHGNARIDIVHPNSFDENNQFELRRKNTLELMNHLNGNGSPAALESLPMEDRLEAFTPTPKILPATDILFDAWSLTTIRGQLPGRPPVADWLHGVAQWEPPETYVAWRDEVEVIDPALAEVYKPEGLLDDYPLKPHELLRDRTDRVLVELQKLAERHGDEAVWVVSDTGVEINKLREVVQRDPKSLKDRIVLLPSSVGGLEGGMLDGDATSANDVADEWYDDNQRHRCRMRVWDNEQPPVDMRLVRIIDTTPQGEESILQESGEIHGSVPDRRYWRWYAMPRTADDDGSRSGRKAVELDVHTGDVTRNAEQIVAALDMAQTAEGKALVFAAQWHDLGKDRQVWQRSIRNEKYPTRVLAKSGNRRPPVDFGRYRHEFGSLLDVLSPDFADEWNRLDEAEKELTLHFIATHHGRARPHFPHDEAFDPEYPSIVAADAARAVPQRFAWLQRKYGRWGLAYLESILRAADGSASANPSKTLEEESAKLGVAVVTGDLA